MRAEHSAARKHRSSIFCHVGNIEIRERFLGGGYVGHVQVDPALSWADRRALGVAASAASASAIELRGLNARVDIATQLLAGLGVSQAMVAHQIAVLEEQLGLRLDSQTRALEAQTEQLARIEHALRTPAKTRAAERIADTGQLLRRRRWERALGLAEQASDDDPNNPAAFRAAGWALLGLERLDDAKQAFLECADAADGDERSEALRQAARLEFALSDAQSALKLLSREDEGITTFERHAIQYDRAIYDAADGRVAEATAALWGAMKFDERFAFWAVYDDLIGARPELAQLAPSYLSELMADITRGRADVELLVARTHHALTDRPLVVEQRLPALGGEPYEALVRRFQELRARVEAFDSPHGFTNSVRRELQTELHPEATSLADEAEKWRAEPRSTAGLHGWGGFGAVGLIFGMSGGDRYGFGVGVSVDVPAGASRSSFSGRGDRGGCRVGLLVLVPGVGRVR